MPITEIEHPGKSADTGAYSSGILTDDGWLFVSGQGPLDLSTGEVIRGSIEDETELTLTHIRKIVEAAGGSMENIVKCTAHLSDINDFDRYNKTYTSFFPGIKPARTTVQSVLADGIKVEIDAIAKIKIK
jgi:2-iminobutanoate/2-iminopropanoate deaminase